MSPNAGGDQNSLHSPLPGANDKGLDELDTPTGKKLLIPDISNCSSSNKESNS